MRIVVGADEVLPLARDVVDALAAWGHEVTTVGPLAGEDREWAETAARAARAVADGGADRAVVLCWSGTGASIAANKIPGVRCALCADADTARMARRYNHANALALSMRVTALPVGREILAAFLEEPDGAEDFDVRNVLAVSRLEEAPHTSGREGVGSDAPPDPAAEGTPG